MEWSYNSDPCDLVAVLFTRYDVNTIISEVQKATLITYYLYDKSPNSVDVQFCKYFDWWVRDSSDVPRIRMVLFPNPAPIIISDITTFSLIRYFTEFVIDADKQQMTPMAIRINYYRKCANGEPYYSFGCCEKKWYDQEWEPVRSMYHLQAARQHFCQATLYNEDFKRYFPQAYTKFCKFKTLNRMSRSKLRGIYKVMTYSNPGIFWSRARLVRELYIGPDIPDIYK